ncbi:RNA-binding domain-containing protein [Cristinia sonorae]|uniref:RNA-binding domain-containing protein n=1 Tax=Cristinia sonorae TaxID=1940300 RepID=A0A8K0UNY4_9AGAR|nr:RNA-binding domain-containing protein [Cristinia sonorae]
MIGPSPHTSPFSLSRPSTSAGGNRTTGPSPVGSLGQASPSWSSSSNPSANPTSFGGSSIGRSGGTSDTSAIGPSNDDIEAIIQMATSGVSGRSGPPPRDTRTQLFVGNLPYRIRWQDLKDLFRRAGTVLRADVSLGPDNRSRGYGTVLLATAEDAGRAVDMFNGYEWMTRTLEVRPDRMGGNTPMNVTPGGGGGMGAYPGGFVEEPFGTPLKASGPGSPFVKPFGSGVGTGSTVTTPNIGGFLPFHIQWQDLKDLFRMSGGTILRADVALGTCVDGRSRGFGMVTFATEGDAERARAMFNGYVVR